MPDSVARPALDSASQSLAKSAIILFAIFTLLTGLLYPVLVTIVAQVVFPHQAEGSLISHNVGNDVDSMSFDRISAGSKSLGRKSVVVGSRLVGQSFSSPRYFWSRPSSTTPAYNATASSGSNLGPTNPDFLAIVAKRTEAFRLDNSIAGKSAGENSGDKNSADKNSERIPVDIVTASASGLDPDISPAAARLQIERVATARSLGREQLQKLVAEHTQGRDFGLLGDCRVNVLELNLALDQLSTKM
ncbi:K(+)-transporting ATPase subunit C [bacterium]|nr:K(+)-transporting ATPase subunit C [bacterium]